MRRLVGEFALVLACSCWAQEWDFPHVPDTDSHYHFFEDCHAVGFKVTARSWPNGRPVVGTGPRPIDRSEFAVATIEVVDTFESVLARQPRGPNSLAFFTNTWRQGLLAWIKEFAPELKALGRSPEKMLVKVNRYAPKVKATADRLRKLLKK